MWRRGSVIESSLETEIVTFARISAQRNRVGDDAEAAAKDGLAPPQVPRTGGDCDRQPDANRHRQVADQMNLHATAGSGEPRGTAVRIASADPLDRQMVRHTGSLGLEGPAQTAGSRIPRSRGIPG